jgi:hypothetical protein
MKKRYLGMVAGCLVAVFLAVVNMTSCSSDKSSSAAELVTPTAAQQMIEDGKQAFRFNTFGDEAFWGGALRLHEAIATVTPRQALDTNTGFGLKVDLDALPATLVEQLRNGQVNLNDPSVTLALLKQNAVVGVTGFFSQDGATLTSIGIQCALCHSTVDDALAPGIGHRLDGWANRDLDVGSLVAAAPNLQPFVDVLKPVLGAALTQDAVRAVLKGWGRGKFDAELILDGKIAKPGGAPGSSATLLPPAFGLAGVNLHTWTGWGSVTHWNAFVAVLEMHAQGTFYDPRLRESTNADGTPQFPVAIANNFDNVRPQNGDLVTPKVAALHFYQLSLPAPSPPAASFNATAAARGKALFAGKAKCATCHVPPIFTEPGWNMHKGSEIGIDDFQANRAPDKRYRTSPLKGLWTHQKGGFYHDGRFATILDVVNHYDSVLTLALTDAEKADLVEYLKSI